MQSPGLGGLASRGGPALWTHSRPSNGLLTDSTADPKPTLPDPQTQSKPQSLNGPPLPPTYNLLDLQKSTTDPNRPTKNPLLLATNGNPIWIPTGLPHRPAPPTNKPPNGPQIYAPNRPSTPILKAEMSLVEEGEGAGGLDGY